MRLVQKAFTFDDVLLVPAYSAVLPRDVQLSTRLSRNISINIPLVSVQHHYAITEPIEGVTPTLPTIRDPGFNPFVSIGRSFAFDDPSR